VVRNDLESRWFDPQAFLQSELGAKEDRAVIVNSTNGVGVGIFLHGNVAGSYTNHALVAVASVDPLVELIGPNSAGTVTILERVADDSGEPFLVAPVIEAPVAEVQEEAQPRAEREPQTEAALQVRAAAEPKPEPVTAVVSEEPELSPSQVIAQTSQPEPPVQAPSAEPDAVHTETEIFATAATSPPEGIGSVAAAFKSMSSVSPEPQTYASVEQSPPPPSEQLPPLAVTNQPAPATVTSRQIDPPTILEAEPTNYAAIVTELLDIGTQYLGNAFDPLAPVVASCSHTPQGLREAIVAVRDATLPGQPPDRLRAAARAMQLCVADRVTGT
jgi:hypothetical protein